MSSSNGQRFEPPNRVQVNRPNSPTQSHSHSHALSREVLSDQQSVPIAESWCITKVKRLKFQCLLLFVGKFLFSYLCHEGLWCYTKSRRSSFYTKGPSRHTAGEEEGRDTEGKHVEHKMQIIAEWLSGKCSR